jgi:hypothetical protein
VIRFLRSGQGIQREDNRLARTHPILGLSLDESTVARGASAWSVHVAASRVFTEIL